MNHDEETRLAHLFEHQNEIVDQKLRDELSQISKQSASLGVPPMDKTKVKSLINLRIHNDKKTAKTFNLYKWVVSAAAVFILLFGYFFLFESSVNIHTIHGQQMAYELPDHSKVHLNANSEISYKKNFEKRTLNLHGEAFFEVEKGSKFVVITEHGAVTVLGTSFNVISTKGFFIVSCKTGRVAVNNDDNQVVLNPNQQVSLKSEGQFSEVEQVSPSNIGKWNSGQSYFNSTPLKLIVTSLNNMYNVSIDLPSKYEEEVFTGSFVNDDLQKALKMVFSPMNINYTIGNDNVINIVE